VISGFRRDVDEICALLGCYAASETDGPLKMGHVPKRRYGDTVQCCVISQKNADLISFLHAQFDWWIHMRMVVVRPL
jgi:hypothetical protein